MQLADSKRDFWPTYLLYVYAFALVKLQFSTCQIYYIWK